MNGEKPRFHRALTQKRPWICKSLPRFEKLNSSLPSASYHFLFQRTFQVRYEAHSALEVSAFMPHLPHLVLPSHHSGFVFILVNGGETLFYGNRPENRTWDTESCEDSKTFTQPSLKFSFRLFRSPPSLWRNKIRPLVFGNCNFHSTNKFILFFV